MNIARNKAIAIMHSWPRGQNFRHLNVTGAPELFVEVDAVFAIIYNYQRVYIKCFTYLHISIKYPSKSLYKFCVRLIDWTPINYSKKNINKYCKINLLQKVINEIQMCSINNPLKIILKIIIAKIEKDIRLFFSSAKRHFRLHDWRCFYATASE